ncbi:MAG: hypothetical protein HON04_13285 [Planctomicrobium sp.]|jgi:hypothetical protein|nr:hypothetical protein [Planctomicrobium sp.]
MDRRRHTVWCLITLTLINGIIPPNIFADGWSFGTTTIEEVAKRIDRLQKQIDDHGVIVAKKPDVWGESRLLRHREEFETQMKLELPRFRSTLQAKESTRDVAFLASALAVSGNIPAITPPGSDTSSQNAQTINVDVASLLPAFCQVQANSIHQLVA